MIEGLVVLGLSGLAAAAAMVAVTVGGSSTVLLAAQDAAQRRQQLSTLSEMLEQAGLDRTGSARWEGHAQGAELDADEPGAAFPCRIRVEVRTGDLGVTRHRRPAGTPTGDPELDRRFRVRGSPGDRARLGHAARARWLALAEVGRIALADGALELRLPALPRSELAAAVDVLHALATALEGLPLGPVERLERVARYDVLASVRIRALADLERLDADAAARVAGRGLHDDDPEIRLASARHLQWVDPLLTAALDATLPDRLRSQAGRWLLGLVPDAELAAIARQMARSGRPELEEAAVAMALHAGDEQTLVPLLVAKSPTALRAALVALRELGTGRALPALRRVEQESAALTGRRRLASEAIDAIRGREAAHAGGLAIAELAERAGAISPADGGSLSLA